MIPGSHRGAFCRDVQHLNKTRFFVDFRMKPFLCMMPLLSIASCASTVARVVRRRVNQLATRSFNSTPILKGNNCLNSMFLSITTYNVGGLGSPLRLGGNGGNDVVERLTEGSLPPKRAFGEIVRNLEALNSDIFVLQEISDYEVLLELKEQLPNGDGYEAYLVTNPDDSERSSSGP